MLSGLLGWLLVSLLQPGAACGAQARLRVEPPEIAVGMFYNGADVRIEASVEGDHELAVLCSGKKRTLELKQKGKVWGILWMNVGDVTLEQVPSLYLLSTSRPLEELARPGTLARLGLGYRALASSVRSTPPENGAGGSFLELVKLKESEGLYSVSEGALKVEREEDGGLHAVAECRFPARASQGDYEISLFGFRDGQGRQLASRSVTVSQTGLALLTSTLARRHGLAYGVLAVVIALTIGLLTGFALGRLSRMGH